MVMRPLDPQELLDKCDIAGKATVKEILRNPRGGVMARLHFTSVKKGFWKLFFSRTVNVAMRGSADREDGVAIPGEWSDGYAKGMRVFTHLEWDKDAGAYRTTHWNAVSVLPD